MDPLSDVLALLKVRNYVCRGFEAGGNWSIHFGPSHGIKFLAVVSGEGWLSVEGAKDPIAVSSGDCVLLPSGRAFQAASDLRLPAVDGTQLFGALNSNEIARFSEGRDCFGVAGHFEVAGENADLLLCMLPPIVHIQKESDRKVLRWCLERMREESQDPQPGASLVAQQLAGIMLVQILRTHLANREQGNVGWLYALADKKISLSMHAIHREPARHWSVTMLAKQAGMSRTSFAVRFKEVVGTAPIAYLTRWRMSLAKDRILHSGDAIGAIAEQVGYESESAFSTAFSRLVGCSPRGYACSKENSAVLNSPDPIPSRDK